MPGGKPAGERCVNLLEDYRCSIYYDLGYPTVCAGFTAEKEFCGNDREEAMRILGSLSE
jgi:hypothetical protein